MLVKGLKFFKTFDEKVYSYMTGLLRLENFRENEQLKMYVDENSARAALFDAAKELIQANPLFKDKLKFPTILMESSLQSLYNQSLIRQQHPPQPEKNLMSSPSGVRPVPAGYAYRNIQNNEGVVSFGKYQNSENAWLKLTKETKEEEVTTISINEIKEQGLC